MSFFRPETAQNANKNLHQRKNYPNQEREFKENRESNPKNNLIPGKLFDDERKRAKQVKKS